MKVVKGRGFFFKDEIEIIDAEIGTPLTLPEPLPIFDRDELLLFHRGKIYHAVPGKAAGGAIKIYTTTYGLEALATPGEQEEAYFKKHEAAITKLKREYLERVVNGMPPSGPTGLSRKVGAELVEKVTQAYANLPLSGITGETSVFSRLPECHRALIADDKAYHLFRVEEYVAFFKKAFDREFFKKLEEQAKKMTPQALSAYLSQNDQLCLRKALPLVRNRIWNNDRSFLLHLEDRYWVPMPQKNTDHVEIVTDVRERYRKHLERHVKIAAAGELG